MNAGQGKTASARWIPSVGDCVRYHPIIGEKDDGRVYLVRAIEEGHGGTRCRVWLEGKAGFVAVEALSPDPDDDLDAQVASLVAAAREHLEAHATGSGVRAIRRRLAAREQLRQALEPFAQETEA